VKRFRSDLIFGRNVHTVHASNYEILRLSKKKQKMQNTKNTKLARTFCKNQWGRAESSISLGASLDFRFKTIKKKKD